MTQELEAAALDFAGGLVRGRAALPPGAPCANCATPLLGPWCYVCGQRGEDFHRSAWRLVAETFEGLLHFDGRIWKTLPGLFLRPGQLTRSYLDGHRAPQIPPLRLFLVVLLLVFVARAGQLAVINGAPQDNSRFQMTNLRTMSPQDRAKLKKVIDSASVQIMNKPDPAASGWFKTRLAHVLDDPERFTLILEQWSERFAFLSLPLATLLLSLLFVFQRQFYLFDHAIFSLHSLSAMGLMVTVGELLSSLTAGWSFVILWAAPVHLFVHMRGVYATGILGTLTRMFLLFVGTMIGTAFLVLGLFLVGLSGMEG